MTLLQTIGVIIGVIMSIGALALGLGYAYGQFKKGKISVSAEAIDGEKKALDLLSSKVDVLEKLCNSQDTQIKELEKKVDALNFSIKERDKKIDEYMLILQNRNPQFEQFMSLVTKVATESELYMVDDKMKTDKILEGVTKLVGVLQHTTSAVK